LTRLAEVLSWYEHCAFGVKDITTNAAMMLSSEGGEGVTTVKTVFRILIPHPELFS
jgi:hypothetical protein